MEDLNVKVLDEVNKGTKTKLNRLFSGSWE